MNIVTEVTKTPPSVGVVFSHPTLGRVIIIAVYPMGTLDVRNIFTNNCYRTPAVRCRKPCAAGHRVETLKEASQISCQYIDFYELGGGNWNGGNITDAAGIVIGKVSFNGRVWDNNGKEIAI